MLLDKFGEGHPNVSMVQKEIEMFKRQVDSLRESERRLEIERENIIKDLQNRAGATFKTPETKLNERLAALEDQIAVMREEEADLVEMANEQKAQSQGLQVMLSDYRLLQTEMEAVNVLLAGYTEKLQEIDLMPKAGQRTLKRLNMPATGWFYGPKIIIYLTWWSGSWIRAIVRPRAY